MKKERSADLIVDWRATLSADLVRDIEQAIKKFEANEAYEKVHCTVAATLRQMNAIERAADKLTAQICELSPVANGVIFRMASIGFRSYPQLDDARTVAASLKKFSKHVSSAAAFISNSHSPSPDVGQGSGSAMGRDSDLRVLLAERAAAAGVPPFRNPKDKLGVQIVMSLARHRHPAVAARERRSSKKLQAILTAVWHEIRPDQPVNWQRIVRARRSISARALVVQRSASKSKWNTSSHLATEDGTLHPRCPS